ncbi:TetR/AcrR family transcriptional regulator [Rhodococcus rhodnii]|uniref:TetR/AcrR family transcriptional regulator n=1 Tax=Rhodococcus rhodnii TaxID=38312 RepID=A0A6P2CJ59_9NOCA|nr:TetR/AcrR family transcriptional regulator [Rhodococcus rhodnii]
MDREQGDAGRDANSGTRGRRRARISDSETQRRMLQAGFDVVAERGLSLSLEHVSMEELIDRAGVSRTSSYRRWPSKDLFAEELVLAIARATELGSEIPGLAEALASLDPRFLAVLDTAQGRHDLLVEVLRIVIEVDFLAMVDSSGWRTYSTLSVAHLGLRDDALRVRVAEALAETERRFTRSRAEAFERLMALVGYRLAEGTPGGWYQVSTALGALTNGMLAQARIDLASVTATTTMTALLIVSE